MRAKMYRHLSVLCVPSCVSAHSHSCTHTNRYPYIFFFVVSFFRFLFLFFVFFCLFVCHLFSEFRICASRRVSVWVRGVACICEYRLQACSHWGTVFFLRCSVSLRPLFSIFSFICSWNISFFFSIRILALLAIQCLCAGCPWNNIQFSQPFVREMALLWHPYAIEPIVHAIFHSFRSIFWFRKSMELIDWMRHER